MRRHKCSEEAFDISAKEHGQSADTKHTTIAVGLPARSCWRAAEMLVSPGKKTSTIDIGLNGSG
jgi:hypothetical protein